jgi:hypothetical protein
MPEKKASKAANPPADAPMPTMGKLEPDAIGFAIARFPGSLAAASLVFFLVVMVYAFPFYYACLGV